MQQDAFGAVPKIDDGPWPAFPADLTSIALVAASVTGARAQPPETVVAAWHSSRAEAVPLHEAAC